MQMPNVLFISFYFSHTSKSTFSPSGIFGGIRLGIINVLKSKMIKLQQKFQGKVQVKGDNTKEESTDNRKKNVLCVCMFTHLNFGLASSSIQKEKELLKDDRNLHMLEKMYWGGKNKFPSLSHKRSQCLDFLVQLVD